MFKSYNMQNGTLTYSSGEEPSTLRYFSSFFKTSSFLSDFEASREYLNSCFVTLTLNFLKSENNNFLIPLQNTSAEKNLFDVK